MNYERCHKYDLCSNAPDHYGKCDVSAHANAVLDEARRVSGDNADIAMKALRQFGECQQVLSDLVDAVNDETSMYIVAIPEHILEPITTLLDQQKEESK